MVVEVMRFTSDFEGLVKNSDAVISHAGMRLSPKFNIKL